MELIKCKECESEVSSKAETCPKCGARVASTAMGCGTLIGGIVLGVVIILAFSSILSSTSDTKPTAITASRPETPEQAAVRKQKDAAVQRHHSVQIDAHRQIYGA